MDVDDEEVISWDYGVECQSCQHWIGVARGTTARSGVHVVLPGPGRVRCEDCGAVHEYASADIQRLPRRSPMLVNNKRVPNPDEPIEPLIAAYRQAGSCYGAARILNDAGSRTRRGAFWSSKVIGDILRREGVLRPAATPGCQSPCGLAANTGCWSVPAAT
jgi:hypothetical protein